MKRLALLWVCLLPLYADSAYLLPHRWQDARHELTALIRTAETPLFLITNGIEDPEVRRALRKALESGKQVHLITGSQTTASQWAAYKTLDACMLPSNESLTYSLVGAEDGRACLLSMTMETDRMRNRGGLLLCTDAAAFAQTLSLLKQECKGYFER